MTHLLSIVLTWAALSGQGESRQTPPPQKTKTSRALYERLLFYPLKHPWGHWQPKGLEFQDVWFQAKDGTKLHGWYCPCKKPRAVVLYAHGNGANLTYEHRYLAQLQKKLRVSVLAFDYRGYGRSAGVPTVKGVLQDTRAARKQLAKSANVKEQDIVLIGHSLGGAVVTQLAGELSPRGLVLESTFSTLKEIARHHYGRLSLLVPAKTLDSVAHMARYKGPLLQVHGTADRVIPYAQGKKLFAAAQGRKRFVTFRGGSHNVQTSPKFYQHLDRFFDELAKPKP